MEQTLGKTRAVNCKVCEMVILANSSKKFTSAIGVLNRLGSYKGETRYLSLLEHNLTIQDENSEKTTRHDT